MLILFTSLLFASVMAFTLNNTLPSEIFIPWNRVAPTSLKQTFISKQHSVLPVLDAEYVLQ